MAEKMTQKQIYQHIMSVMNDDEVVVEFCEKKIAQLDKHTTSKRKVSPEVQERRDMVMAFMRNAPTESYAVKDLASALGYSSSQVSGAMRGLINAGVVEVVESEKKSQPKQYRLVGADDEDMDF
jgi:DNA-binding transcriptional ArsR family regulator